MMAKVLAYIIYFSPYVFCIGMLVESFYNFRRTKREAELEEQRRKEANRALYILSLELRRLNNRLECKACSGKEDNTEEK